jgi:hypothetical protein
MFFRGLIPNFFHARNARLDQDRAQHHLASMLISIAAGRDEVTRADIAALLHSKGQSRAQIVMRMNHAVKLAGTAVSGDDHARVVALAREFTASV